MMGSQHSKFMTTITFIIIVGQNAIIPYSPCFCCVMSCISPEPEESSPKKLTYNHSSWVQKDGDNEVGFMTRTYSCTTSLIVMI